MPLGLALEEEKAEAEEEEFEFEFEPPPPPLVVVVVVGVAIDAEEAVVVAVDAPSSPEVMGAYARRRISSAWLTAASAAAVSGAVGVVPGAVSVELLTPETLSSAEEVKGAELLVLAEAA